MTWTKSNFLLIFTVVKTTEENLLKYTILLQIAHFHSKSSASIITVILLLHMASPIYGMSLSLKYRLCKSQRNFLTDMLVNVDSQSMFYIYIYIYIYIVYLKSVPIPNAKSPVSVGYAVVIAISLKAKQTFLMAAILLL